MIASSPKMCTINLYKRCSNELLEAIQRIPSKGLERSFARVSAKAKRCGTGSNFTMQIELGCNFVGMPSGVDMVWQSLNFFAVQGFCSAFFWPKVTPMHFQRTRGAPKRDAESSLVRGSCSVHRIKASCDLERWNFKTFLFKNGTYSTSNFFGGTSNWALQRLSECSKWVAALLRRPLLEPLQHAAVGWNEVLHLRCHSPWNSMTTQKQDATWQKNSGFKLCACWSSRYQESTNFD